MRALATLPLERPVGSAFEYSNLNHNKYRSTHWTMLLLTELGIDGQDARFQRGVDYILNATVQKVQHRLATGHLGFSCLWGNLLRYALHAGRREDAKSSS